MAKKKPKQKTRFIDSGKRNKHHPTQPPTAAGIKKPLPPKPKPKPKSKSKSKPSRPPPPPKPTIPFTPADRLLLLGEGDLSFTTSLITHHSTPHIVATVLEPCEAALLEKYPHAAENLAVIRQTLGARVQFNVDATRLPAMSYKPPGPDAENYEYAGQVIAGKFDRILFNFPHVGGKSTDVNRQVRYNQELLVSFFKSSQKSLAKGGAIIVTLFEGEPYTLWNIRDLARHSGLQVERSFRFQAGVYPGYRHARTLGVVKNKNGETGGGWKGEERLARSFVFVRKGEEILGEMARKSKKEVVSDSDSD